MSKNVKLIKNHLNFINNGCKAKYECCNSKNESIGCSYECCRQFFGSEGCTSQYGCCGYMDNTNDDNKMKNKDGCKGVWSCCNFIENDDTKNDPRGYCKIKWSCCQTFNRNDPNVYCTHKCVECRRLWGTGPGCNKLAKHQVNQDNKNDVVEKQEITKKS